MSKRFLFSDPHFGHKNILLIADRPFNTVQEMNESLIKNWNSVVGNDDTVYLLGDICMNMSKKTITELLYQLKGDIILIMGNHDWEFGKDFWANTGRFSLVSPYPIILDKWFMLSHEPMYLTSNMPYGNIYGHVHNDNKYRDYTKNSFCVCAERINYTPIEFTDLTNKMIEYEDNY